MQVCGDIRGSLRLGPWEDADIILHGCQVFANISFLSRTFCMPMNGHEVSPQGRAQGPHRPGQTQAAITLLRLLPGKAGALASNLPWSLAPLPPAPVHLEGFQGSDTQSAPGKLSWSLIVHGATAMRKGKQGGRKALHSGRPGWWLGALRDTPAMDSSPLSQAFLA